METYDSLKHVRRLNVQEEIASRLNAAGFLTMTSGDLRDDADGGGVELLLTWREARRFLRFLRIAGVGNEQPAPSGGAEKG